MKLNLATIFVSDMSESVSFFNKIIGLEIKREFSPAEGVNITFLGNDGSEMTLELIQSVYAEANYGKSISLGFEVDNLDQTISFLQENGITDIEGPIQPGPNVKFIYIQDPDGLKIQLLEHM
jgi:lactoylglutathione lyase